MFQVMALRRGPLWQSVCDARRRGTGRKVTFGAGSMLVGGGAHRVSGCSPNGSSEGAFARWRCVSRGMGSGLARVQFSVGQAHQTRVRLRESGMLCRGACDRGTSSSLTKSTEAQHVKSTANPAEASADSTAPRSCKRASASRDEGPSMIATSSSKCIESRKPQAQA